LVEKVLAEALDLFEIEHARHRLALFTTDERELDTNTTMHDAGAGPGDHLLLRAKTIQIVYNGREEEFVYRPEELVSGLLAQAVSRFGVTTNVHLMSLF
jgi:hypothetical protein